MDILELLKLAVLVVLAGPMLAATLTATLGSRSLGLARRTAAICAFIHLLLTTLVCLLAADLIRQRNDMVSEGSLPAVTFDPVAVPGSVGSEATWSLLNVGIGMTGLPASDVQFYLGFDGLNVWLVLLTSLMTLIAVWVSWENITERTASYYSWLFVLESAIIGTFLSFDILLFYIFFELTLIPVFFLIGNWGVGANRRAAARKFFLYTLLGSLFTLTGIVGVILANPTPIDPNRSSRADANWHPSQSLSDPIPQRVPGPLTFSIPRLMANVQTWNRYYPTRAEQATTALRDAERKLADVSKQATINPNDPALKTALQDAEKQLDLARSTADSTRVEREQRSALHVWLFIALMAGFAVKTPIAPFHTWLPTTYAEAPMAVTMLLSALLAKLGTFGILRVVIPLTPEAAFQYGLPVFGFLGAFGIVYAALCAYAQIDAKLLVAYSSVSHLGLLVLGLFALNQEGVSGAVLHMVNHGLTVGAMFALLGFLYDRYRTLDMNHYSGLLARYPSYAFLFFVIALASVGLPGLNNFISEILLIASVFDPVHTQSIGYGLAIVGAFGVFLSSWYVMTMLRRIFFGPLAEPSIPGHPNLNEVKGLNSREALAYGVPATLCVVLGLYPQFVLDTIRADANVVVNCVDASRIRAGYDGVYRPPTPTKPQPKTPATTATPKAPKKPKTPSTGKSVPKSPPTRPETPATKN